ncbi:MULTISPECIES: endonuclease/exonuclease/phosphatase family protein [unclassified Mesorhizobium]|uniref:endonuclease/exonuclease/phosphatase family protein n=2 Tax=unclassified Mesorhizobium TaxID=325217 RepID=UPI001127DB9C|nr:MULTISPECIES: endonuclease/exonuclease/phosphatase family protein [unclassified Mesorhizobium]TPK60332.1 AP endonuclease [Mesorhizobium sp. B2-5-1]TPM65257.1 AP endonuclease [Mesorhizobium sp. B2-1-9]TPM84050.1 AP endonuclease [Mesorhizobium sp. B2-1-4]TPN14157.1 AP endonuclease [Mesorhizobium sp. B2-1-2]TPK31602.1 AP endonuclease [Mesorhizobium sp. B2-5-3]
MKRSRDMAASLVFIVMMTLSVALVAGFLGALHPALDSFSHFRIHLAVLMALCALPLLATSFRLQAAAALVFAVAALATASTALPRPWPVQAVAKPTDQVVYSLLQMNLRYDNPTPKKVLSLIGRTNPDVITLDEVSTMWATELGYIASAYPYRILCPYPNGVFGVALLSRRPFLAGTAPHCERRGAMAVATIDFGGRSADVAAIHLSWPWPREQYWQIGELSEQLSSLGQTAIMAGDCNAVPWSAAVRRVAALGGLTVMPSAGSTWIHRKLPDFLRRYAGLPIDQAFSKGGVTILSSTRLEDTGSDHLPVLVEFSLRPDDRLPHDEHESALAASDLENNPRG